ncbi:MAG: PH domain-containing protein [Chloroflexota bacterium]
MKDSYLNKLLGSKEKLIVVTRQHWLILLGEIFTEMVLALVTLGLITFIWLTWNIVWIIFGYILLMLPLVSLLRDVLIWLNRKYVVTNRRVIHMSGVISKSVIDSSLEKVNDVKMVQSMLGRIFDYGDIEILTASELGVNRFTRIARPIQFKTAMLNAKAQLEQDLSSGKDVIDIPTTLSRLDILHKQGVLSDKEFEAKKNELLSKL